MKRKKITAKNLRLGDVVRFFGSKKNWLVKQAKIGCSGEFHSGIYMLILINVMLTNPSYI